MVRVTKTGPDGKKYDFDFSISPTTSAHFKTDGGYEIEVSVIPHGTNSLDPKLKTPLTVKGFGLPRDFKRDPVQTDQSMIRFSQQAGSLYLYTDTATVVAEAKNAPARLQGTLVATVGTEAGPLSATAGVFAQRTEDSLTLGVETLDRGVVASQGRSFDVGSNVCELG